VKGFEPCAKNLDSTWFLVVSATRVWGLGLEVDGSEFRWLGCLGFGIKVYGLAAHAPCAACISLCLLLDPDLKLE
jgi:hypothetical protein